MERLGGRETRSSGTRTSSKPITLIGIEAERPTRRLPPGRRTRGLERRDALPPVLEEGGPRYQRASGNRPVVVLANLSGFDGSPESLRKISSRTAPRSRGRS